MVFRVIDLIENKLLREIKFLAGHKVDMPVRWLHVAELSENIGDIRDSIKAGDLLIIMGPILDGQAEKLDEIVRMASDKALAGVLLYKDVLDHKVPETIIEYANQRALNLMQISGTNPPISDLTSTILISINEYNHVVPEFFSQYMLMDIINGDFYGDNIDIFLMRALSFGYDLSVSHQAIWLKAVKKKKKHKKGTQTPAPTHNREWSKCADYAMSNYFEKPYLKANFTPNSVFLIPKTYISPNKLAEQVLAACIEYDKNGEYLFRIGIGSLYDELSQFQKSLQEAKRATEVMEILDLDNCVRHADELILSMLIRSERDNPMYEKMLSKNIQPLLEMDVSEKYDLVLTLKTYFDCGNNVCKAAEKLYLHRNTMKSRLDKIEELTGQSLKNPLDCLELSLALHYYKLCVEK